MSPRKKYDKQAILAAYTRLKRPCYIAEELGIPYHAVMDTLHDAGIHVGHKGKPLPRQYDYAEAVRTYQELGNTVQAAKLLGMSHTHMQKILKSAGITLQRSQPKYALPKEVLYDLYWNKGWSTPQIGEHLGCTDEVVRRRMKKYGIPRRSIQDSRPKGERNSQWKGGKEATLHKYRREAFETVAIFLGQPVPPKVVIHHLDENPQNNAPENLVLFENQAQHANYHQQQLSLQKQGLSVDASRLALENGALRLPSPPAHWLSAPCKDLHVLYDKLASLGRLQPECVPTENDLPGLPPERLTG